VLSEEGMAKKINKYPDGLTLNIDKAIVDALGITQKTAIEMIVVDDMLIIRPKNKRSRATAKRKAKLEDLTNHLMDKYEPVLKKLAKT
jgi:antitoxin component of MazEF toxin-antitoxin module